MVGPVADNLHIYILGDTFIRNFYVTFNYEKLTVNFAERVAPAVTTTGLSVGAKWGISLSVIIILGIVAAVILYLYKKRKEVAPRYVYSESSIEPLTPK